MSKPEIHQSMIRAFEQCPFKGKSYLDGLKGHVVPMFEFGSRLHEYLYAYGDNCQRKGVQRDDEWADAFAATLDDSRLRKAVRQFPLTVVLRPEYEVQGLEHSFSIELEHCVVAGRLDRLEYDPVDKLWRVIDYKSGFKPLRSEDPPFQLKLYAAAVNHLLGHEGDRFECWYVYPEANESLPPSMWTLEQDELAPVLDEVDAWLVNVQAMTRFEPVPSQQACQACPYLMNKCPEWNYDDCPDCNGKGCDKCDWYGFIQNDLTNPIVLTEGDAQFAWQVRQWADGAVKAFIAEHGPVSGAGYAAPKYVEDGLTHWQVAGNKRTKAGKQVVADLINKILRLAVTAGVNLSTALDVKTYWLNKVMADEESEIAQEIRQFVEPIQPEAEFREHLGGEE